MFQHFVTLLKRDRRASLAALVVFTLVFGGGSYIAQRAIDMHQGGVAMLGVLLVLAGLLGQLIALAALFKQR